MALIIIDSEKAPYARIETGDPPEGWVSAPTVDKILWNEA